MTPTEVATMPLAAMVALTSERLSREVLSLPMSAETTPEQVEITVKSIRDFFAKDS